MAYIKDYRTGIERDLQYVIPMDGHPLVKDSIMNQGNRLADIAENNHKYKMEMMSDFFDDFTKVHHIVDYDEEGFIGDATDISKEQFLQEFENWIRNGVIR